MKTRFAKPFESVQIKIPYETGMNPYSGFVELCESIGILTKTGNKLAYTSPATGEVHSYFRKQWTGDKLQLIMDEWGTKDLPEPESSEQPLQEIPVDEIIDERE